MSFFPGSGSLSRRVTPYADPYVDLAQFNTPPSQKALMVLSRRLFLTKAPIHAALLKYSSYPITDIIVEAATSAIRQDWETMVDDVLKLKKYNQTATLDYLVQGNLFGSTVFPFTKMLICPDCNFEQMAEHARYRFNRSGQFDYQGTCPGCRKTEKTFIVEDRPMRGAWNQVSLMRWPPLTIDIEHNMYFPRKAAYFHRIPRELRAQLIAGSKLLTSTLPIEFIQAARFNKRLKICPDNFFHMARNTVSDVRISGSGWGTPILLPVISNAYRHAMLTRAQEAMAQNRILPLRMIWPMMGQQPAMVGGVDMGKWRGHLEDQVRIWTRDPNHIGISPVPMQMGTLGADSRPMLLAQEIQAAEESMVMGMGIPKGFVWGDNQYSAAAVALRQLENEFLALRADMIDLNDGTIRSRIQTYLDWPHARLKFANLRSADDMQRITILLQLMSQGVLSKKAVLTELGFDYETMVKQRKVELDWEFDVAKMTARNGAESQGLGQLTMARYQFETQKMMQDFQAQMQDEQANNPDVLMEQLQHLQQGNVPPQGGASLHNIPEPSPDEAMSPHPNVELDEMMQQHAMELSQMSPQEQQQQLNAMQSANPEYARAVQQQSVNMRPLPEQKPPRGPNSPI